MELLEQFKQKELISEKTPNKYIRGMSQVIHLNDNAIKANYNRVIEDMDRLIDEICTVKHATAPEIWSYNFPILQSFIHNDTEIRIIFTWGEGHALMDISFDDYDALPKIKEYK